ncbi:hypothetical protein AC1031_021693 [Aphanomyces cochlioides]|nr:hypothetical protein AC1031_021693 [Aphanomyces cochlioides]
MLIAWKIWSVTHFLSCETDFEGGFKGVTVGGLLMERPLVLRDNGRSILSTQQKNLKLIETFIASENTRELQLAQCKSPEKRLRLEMEFALARAHESNLLRQVMAKTSNGDFDRVEDEFQWSLPPKKLQNPLRARSPLEKKQQAANKPLQLRGSPSPTSAAKRPAVKAKKTIKESAPKAKQAAKRPSPADFSKPPVGKTSEAIFQAFLTTFVGDSLDTDASPLSEVALDVFGYEIHIKKKATSETTPTAGIRGVQALKELQKSTSFDRIEPQYSPFPNEKADDKELSSEETNPVDRSSNHGNQIDENAKVDRILEGTGEMDIRSTFRQEIHDKDDGEQQNLDISSTSPVENDILLDKMDLLQAQPAQDEAEKGEKSSSALVDDIPSNSVDFDAIPAEIGLKMNQIAEKSTARPSNLAQDTQEDLADEETLHIDLNLPIDDAQLEDGDPNQSKESVQGNPIAQNDVIQAKTAQELTLYPDNQPEPLEMHERVETTQENAPKEPSEGSISSADASNESRLSPDDSKTTPRVQIEPQDDQLNAFEPANPSPNVETPPKSPQPSSDVTEKLISEPLEISEAVDNAENIQMGLISLPEDDDSIFLASPNAPNTTDDFDLAISSSILDGAKDILPTEDLVAVADRFLLEKEAVIAIQRHFRGHRGRKLFQSTLYDEAKACGVLGAMPGTSQGGTGWYQEPDSCTAHYFVVLPSGEWKHKVKVHCPRRILSKYDMHRYVLGKIQVDFDDSADDS